MATRAEERRKARAQRQRTRTQRQRQRQREKTRRRATRQDARTRRAEGRQLVRQERVKQKGASGFYSPEGIKARGGVASDLIGQGVDIAGMFTTGGLSGLVGGGDSGRRDAIGGLIDTFGGGQEEVITMSGGGGGAMMDFQEEEEKPFYTKPIFIGGAVLGGFLLYRSMSKRK